MSAKKVLFVLTALLFSAAAAQDLPNAATTLPPPDVGNSQGAPQAAPMAPLPPTMPPAQPPAPLPPSAPMPPAAERNPQDAGAFQTPPVIAAEPPPPVGAQALPEAAPAVAAPQPPLPPPKTAPAPPPPPPVQAASGKPDAAAPPDKTLPNIAVYVTGNVSDDEKKALGTRMLAALVNSGRYRGVERTGAFLDAIDSEQMTQRSGAVDDSQISALGKQFGVKYVCVADITPLYGQFQVSARVVDVETAEVVFISETTSPLKTASDLIKVSDAVVIKMFSGRNVAAGREYDFSTGERMRTWVINVVPGLGSYLIMDDKKGAWTNMAIAAVGITVLLIFNDDYTLGPLGLLTWLGGGSLWNIYRSATYHHPYAQRRPKPENRISAGAGGFYDGSIINPPSVSINSYSSGGQIHMPYSGGGGYVYFDAIYAEVFFGYSSGGGKWESGDVWYEEDLPEMPRQYLNMGAFLKYPIGRKSIRWYPLIGLEYELSTAAKLVYENGREYKFDGEGGRPEAGDLSALTPKFGFGMDVNIYKKIYLRGEAMTNMTLGTVTDFQKSLVDGNGGYADAGLGLTLKVGAGWKF